MQTALGECWQGPAGELKSSVGAPCGPVDFRAMLAYARAHSHSMC